ncbi:MAG: preprotein translocase subunit SecY [Mycoplasma sp.]|nr:preprotein translocase subunit SecY [Mycoplasma sp.]
MDFFKRTTDNISLFFSKIFLFFKKNVVLKLKEKELLRRILYTLLIMVIFVSIGTVTLPGVKVSNSGTFNDTSSFIGIMNTIGGGGLRQFSLVSLGISPFITASLIMTFAQTKLFPPIYRLYQSGPAGRVKINYITYGLTFLFAIVQGIVIIQTLLASTNAAYISIDEKFNNSFFIWIVLPFILTAGTFFSMYLSEQITNKGVGNGSSMLILAGTIISLPNLFTSAWSTWIQGKVGDQLFRGIVYLIGFVLVFILMVFIISFVYQAERKIPIQHTGVGRSKNIKDLSYLPIKLNIAGIMPIIFSSMLITFPMLIVNMVHDFSPSNVTRWMLENFQLKQPIGLVIFASSTFLITIFLSIQQSRIDKIVEDFNKSSTFIPGIRPGEQTEDYLFSIVIRLSIFSAIYLTILGSSQYVAIIAGSPENLVISGTSIMIVITVSIETIQQIAARRKASNLFQTKKSKKNNSSINMDSTNDNKGSILW